MRLIDADQFGVISLQGKSKDFIEGVMFMLNKIDEAPTIEPDRPHGEWEQVGEMTYKCTKCGWLKKTGLMPFCENCGASMISSNSEIEKSKSEIVPDYRDGWRLKEGDSDA